MNIEAITHGFVLLVINLKKLYIWIHLCQLTYLPKKGLPLAFFQKTKSIKKKKKQLNHSYSHAHAPHVYRNSYADHTLGWRALQPPHPGEKKSTTTSWSPAFIRESTRSCAEVTSLMLGCRPFSHHFLAYLSLRPVY
jgi:hypothetical protein